MALSLVALVHALSASAVATVTRTDVLDIEPAVTACTATLVQPHFVICCVQCFIVDATAKHTRAEHLITITQYDILTGICNNPIRYNSI
jgi:hypothetical protein